MRPQSLAPRVHALAGIEDVERVHEAAAVRAELREVEPVVAQVGQRLGDQLPSPAAERDRRVGVVRPVLLRRVVGGDHVAVAQLPLRDLEEVVTHRTVVAEAAVAGLVAEVVDLLAGDRAGHVRELDEDAQPGDVADSSGLRRRGQAFRRRLDRGAPLAPTLLPAPLDGRCVVSCRCSFPGGRSPRAQVLRNAERLRLRGADARPERQQRRPIVGQAGVMVEPGDRVVHDGVPVERLEDRFELVAPPQQPNLGAIRLLKGEQLTCERNRHHVLPLLKPGRIGQALSGGGAARPGRRYAPGGCSAR